MWVDHLADDFLRCRDVGHQWSDGSDRKFRVAKGIVGRELQCTSCGTQRIDVYIERTGQLEMRRYIYPSGYSRPDDGDIVRQIDFRTARFKRLEEEAGTERIKLAFTRTRGWKDA